jgi:hypothetical protein
VLYIESKPVEAIRVLYELVKQADFGRLPTDPDLLLALAMQHQESFPKLLLDPAPAKLCRESAVLQFQLLAVLFDHHALPLFRLSHGRRDTVTLIYAEMLRRILLHTDLDGSFPSLPARSYLDPLATKFATLSHQISNSLRSPSALPGLLETLGDYLNYLAILHFKISHVPV